MQYLSSLLTAIVILSFLVSPQSGRKGSKTVKLPAPPVEEQSQRTSDRSQKNDEALPVTAEKDQEYRCTEDGSLARILVTDSETERVLSQKEVDSRAVITSRPRPSYTKEARRIGVQGNVVLKVVLSSEGKISRVRVIRRLPFGLTESAIRSACRIEFKPATKDGRPASQWATVEYPFRLAESSILGP